jgi:hypothetical protein
MASERKAPPEDLLPECDPRRLHDWTFVMAIAFIATGDLEVVRAYWNAYRQERGRILRSQITLICWICWPEEPRYSMYSVPGRSFGEPCGSGNWLPRVST